MQNHLIVKKKGQIIATEQNVYVIKLDKNQNAEKRMWKAVIV